MPCPSRRTLFLLLPVVGATIFPLLALGQSTDANVDRNMILHDPAAPVGGNPNGDITIIAFTDYNCPFCKKSSPDLDRIVKEDGHVRVIYKEWPILAATSKSGARLAIAANYQGKYETAHRALMAIPGGKVTEERMLEALKSTDIDMNRLASDMKAHQSEIDALIQRNSDQADSLGFQGTPTYLIGSFLASALDYAGFKRTIAEARQESN
ncbi:MAG: DsbA family protein [Proteobacteria bacterium]|nr:DsbA family protein [Pseudomonadota bacterium]